MKKTISIFAFVLCFSACNEGPTKQPVQQDTAKSAPKEETLFTSLSPKQTNINFRNMLVDNPLDPTKNVMDFFNYFNGGGVAVGDFNNDGLEDLVFSGNEVQNKIYINKGGLTFEDITAKANINEHKFWTTGVMVEDINSDGFDDIYFSQSGPFHSTVNQKRNLVFINNKDLTFSEKAMEMGLADPNLSEHAVFFDYDRDGDKDCFVLNTSIYVRIALEDVLNHLNADKRNLEAASSNLYRNDDGKFVKVTEQAGMLRYGFGLGVMVSDINDDGWLDIYQTNDYSVPDFMYINQKNGTFKDEIKKRTKHISWFSMGVDIADFDNDGTVDIGVVDMAATDHVRGKTLMAPMNIAFFNTVTYILGYQRQHMYNSLQKNNGDGTFNNVAGICGMLASEWSWTALFADFDNDGWKDYFVSNGFKRYVRDNDSRIRIGKVKNQYKGSVPPEKRKELYAEIPQVKIPNYLFKNKNGLEFEEVGKSWGIGKPGYSNGAAYADLDNDGDLDLIVNDVGDYAKVYRNNSKNNYLDIKLISDQPLEGTKVFLRHNDQVQLQEYGTVRGYQSSVTKIIHFGLGDIAEIDSLEIIWPNGKRTTRSDISANKRLTFDYKEAKAPGTKPTRQKNPIFKYVKSDFKHVENQYNDYKLEVLLPYQQSTLGPFVGVGDVNKDGLDDFYIGGAKGQSGQLMVRAKGSNNFVRTPGPWAKHAASEDMGSHFFDYDNDGDLDLYVISGGNDFQRNDPLLQDRLYINQGNGRFKDATDLLPQIRGGGSRVKSADLDLDGDLDLFVAGRLEPKYYPNPTRSYILINENGKFVDKTESWSAELLTPGLVNDFLFTDVNNDGKPDLILAGEWMPMRTFVNNGSSFAEETSQYFPDNLSGWHFRIAEADIDQDGDLDLIVGNLGLNSKFKATKKKTFKIYANDFDDNGTCDIVLAKDYHGKTVPVRGRECSSEQMPFILDKFKTYNEFAHASIADILGEQKINQGIALQVNNFETGIYYKEGSTYNFKPLNRCVQQSVTNSIIVKDFNSDNKLDLLLGGNIYNMEVETPPLSASNGFLLLQGENGEFRLADNIDIGLNIGRDVKDMSLIKGTDGTQYLSVANNNSLMQLLKVTDR